MVTHVHSHTESLCSGLPLQLLLPCIPIAFNVFQCISKNALQSPIVTIQCTTLPFRSGHSLVRFFAVQCRQQQQLYWSKGRPARVISIQGIQLPTLFSNCSYNTVFKHTLSEKHISLLDSHHHCSVLAQITLECNQSQCNTPYCSSFTPWSTLFRKLLNSDPTNPFLHLCSLLLYPNPPLLAYL